MNDDIVTRPEEQMDFVEYLRLWASPDGDDQAVRDLHKAADEIERLRKALEQCEAERDTWRTVAETEHIRFTNELKAVSPIQAGLHHPEIGGSIV